MAVRVEEQSDSTEDLDSCPESSPRVQSEQAWNCSEDLAGTLHPEFAFVRHYYRPSKKMLQKLESICFKANICAKY